jgi:Uma2 family endonuclease
MAPKAPVPNEQRLVLKKISWQKYEEILIEMGAERKAHLTYDRGSLEMMTPTEEHERCSKLLESLLLLLADELKQNIKVNRKATLKEIDLQQALEPELCCFWQDSPAPKSRSSVAKQGQAPDLALDVTLSYSPMDKFPIYANFGIREVWHYRNGEDKTIPSRQLRIYHLQERENPGYIQAKTSLHFPFLTASTIQQFLDQSDTLGLMPALKLLRQWVENPNF